MKIEKIIIVSIIATLFIITSVFAVDYPIISTGINGGWGKNELSKSINMRIFVRYSLEAYVPGFQIEGSYCHSFFDTLSHDVVESPDANTDFIITDVTMNDNLLAISGTFHLNSFGNLAVLYAGGGANLNFLKVTKKIKEKYWDSVGEKYQHQEIENVELYSNTIPGFHALGGIRFLLGKFGSFDIEARQTFLTTNSEDWAEEARDKYGDKKWNSFSVNLGLTIFIF